MLRMNKDINRSAERQEKKTTERNRRIHMKALCDKLTSLIPQQQLNPSEDMLSLPDQLDEAANYIKQLKERVEALKSRRKGTTTHFELREFGCGGLEVVIVSGLEKKFRLHEIITILEEEGVEVLTANVSTIGDKVFHTLHAQVRVSRIGIDTSRVWGRLQELIS